MIGKMLLCSAAALTLDLLTLKIWRDPNDASKWQMGFNSALKGLTCIFFGIRHKVH
jgi:hypothetical protein